MIDSVLLSRTYHALYYYYQSPGVKQWWAGIGRDQFSSEFVAFVEDTNTAGLKINHQFPAAQADPADLDSQRA